MGKSETSTSAVCDTGPIIHLDKLDSVQLLSDFSLWVPKAVVDELHYHRPSAFNRISAFCQVNESLEPLPPNLLALGRAFSLEKGEIEALSLMSCIPNAILLTDDAAARLVAQQLGYRVHGTIGVLIRAIRQRNLTVDQVLELLRAIPERSSLFVRSVLLEEIVRQVENKFNIT